MMCRGVTLRRMHIESMSSATPTIRNHKRPITVQIFQRIMPLALDAQRGNLHVDTFIATTCPRTVVCGDLVRLQ